jgi:hypothetical protein
LGVGSPAVGGADIEVEEIGEGGGWKSGGAAGAAQVNGQVRAQGAR